MAIVRCIIINVFLLLVIFGSSRPLFSYARENTQDVFRVYLYMDKLSFREDEPVVLHICVKNYSGQRESLVVYDAQYTTFRPIVYDNGKEAEIIVPYRLMNRKMNKVLKSSRARIIELSRNETFQYSVDLRNIYKIEADKEYRVKANFFRDAKGEAALSSENILTFRIYRPTGPIGRSAVKRRTRSISPSEVVLLFLNAEKSSKWDNYFKYIRLESYIDAYPDYVRIYKKADEIKKAAIIDDFIKFLKKKRIDYIIDFEVLDPLMRGRTTAYVDAEVKRYGPRYPFIYKYRYTLERFRSFWVITDVEASVIKGQKS